MGSLDLDLYLALEDLLLDQLQPASFAMGALESLLIKKKLLDLELNELDPYNSMGLQGQIKLLLLLPLLSHQVHNISNLIFQM